MLAIYRKHIIDARFQSLADKSKNINLNQEERVLQLSVGKVADTRLTNVLYKEEIRTVGQLLELVSGKGWRWLLKMEGVGRISYDRLLSNLQLAGVVDESLEQILSVVLTDDEGQKSIVLGELLLTFDISSSLCGDDSSVF